MRASSLKRPEKTLTGHVLLLQTFAPPTSLHSRDPEAALPFDLTTAGTNQSKRSSGGVNWAYFFFCAAALARRSEWVRSMCSAKARGSLKEPPPLAMANSAYVPLVQSSLPMQRTVIRGSGLFSSFRFNVVCILVVELPTLSMTLMHGKGQKSK